MNGLIFTPDRNSPTKKNPNKKDYTGAFRPMARQFADKHNIPRENIIAINVGKGFLKRQKQVLDALKEHDKLDTVAFFCHGYSTGIQLGFRWRPRAGEKPAPALNKLAKGIYAATDRTDICVPLFCCSTGDIKKGRKDKKSVGGDGGFADELRDALCRAGATENRVFAHTTAAHTTYNPYGRFFDGKKMPAGGIGGYWIASPGGPLWRPWKKYLRSGGWKEMPFLDVDDIRAELVA